MVETVGVTAIEPRVLGQLADKALQATKEIKNPCLRGLMARFAYVALELKVALENEAHG